METRRSSAPADSPDTALMQRVAILLCTYRGQRFLDGQMASILAQTHTLWKIFASDDGGTVDHLEAHQQAWGEERLSVRLGPGKGWVTNFLSLACDSTIEADFYCFADQDDIWEQDKLARALGWLRTIPQDTPALYCGRTRLIDDEDREIGCSPLFSKPPTFRNALVQSIAGGNTMVFNRATRALLMAAGPDVDVQTHDWWAYIVVSGCGGIVRYDPDPLVRYRQHGENLVGSNSDWRARWVRARRLLAGRFRSMNTRNIRALNRIKDRMAPDSRRIFDDFCEARDKWLIPRVLGILRCRLYLQTTLGNLGLWAAVVLKKV